MITFIFFIILYFIKAEDISLWEKKPEIIEGVIDDVKNNIDSYAVDDETGVELYSINENGKSKFILKDRYTTVLRNKYDKLFEIKSPLIKLNSKYYCCSTESLIWTDGFEIHEESIKDNNIKDLNCLRAIDKIFVSFIGTQNYSYFIPLNDSWGKNFTEPGYVIHAINNYTYKDNINYYTAFYIKENEPKNYNFSLFKIDNQDNIIIEKSLEKDKEKMELFLNYNPKIELITKEHSNGEDFVTFLFSYVPSTSLYSIYHIDLSNEVKFYEIKFFSFFNDLIIKNAGFVLYSPFLYYSVESMINGQTYIGLADIEYSLLIYNIEENINNKLYYNYGSHFKDKGKLFYFSGNKQISFCPFIRSENYCIDNLVNSKFNIFFNNESKLYTNSEVENCENKKIVGKYYCVDDCPNRFIDNDNGLCYYCDIEEGNSRFFIGSKKCIHQDNCDKSRLDSSTCYDCEQFENTTNDIIFYKFNCIHSCEQIHGEEINGGNITCISCKDKSTENEEFFYSYIEKKCTKCENGIKNKEKNICIECANYVDNKTLFFPDLGKCVENCEQYYAITINNARCEYCSNNQSYENGECVDDCNSKEGYGLDKNIFNEY